LIVFIDREFLPDSYVYKQLIFLGDCLHSDRRKANKYSSEDFEQSENILLKFFGQAIKKGNLFGASQKAKLFVEAFIKSLAVLV